MSHRFTITHYYHSGFSIACQDMLLVFDYWRGENGELTPQLQLTEDEIRGFRRVIVFISHEHPDHLDSIVFTWKDLTDVTYIVSSDMPIGIRGKRMAPGDDLKIDENCEVLTFDSTDLGVSFLVRFYGCTFFHAGDLNFWHWREESSMREIEEADEEFRKAVKPIAEQKIDLAFFPLDPRQGAMFEAGANYFILTVKPRLFIPMHYFGRSDIAEDYARTAGNRSTEVLVMPGLKDQIELEKDEQDYLNISFPTPKSASDNDSIPHPDEDPLSVNNPFAESDLPLTQLADSSRKEE